MGQAVMPALFKEKICHEVTGEHTGRRNT